MRTGSKIGLMAMSAILITLPAPGHADLPVISTPNLEYVASVPYRGGTDLEFQDRVVNGETRSYLYAGSLDYVSRGTSTGLRIVDVTVPAQPVVKSFLTCDTNQNDVQVVERGTKTYVVLGTDSGGDPSSDCYKQLRRNGDFRGLMIVDVTDVSAPRAVAALHLPYGAHNSTLHPGGRYLYVSEAELVRPRGSLPSPYFGEIQVIDLGNILQPMQVSRFIQPLGGSSHDITFNRSGTRAYSAALVNTIVLDTVDPSDPKLISVIEDPSVSIHHQADPYTVGGREYLLVTDEQAAGMDNVACPGGGVHVFDVTIEQAPVKVGAFFIPKPQFEALGRFACTSHVLRIYPEQMIMTIGWYGAGTWVVDVLDPLNLRAVGHANPTSLDGRRADTWVAKMHRGHIYSNDMGRGIDVFRYGGPATQAEMAAGIDGIAAYMRQMPGPTVSFADTSTRTAMYCFQLNTDR